MRFKASLIFAVLLATQSAQATLTITATNGGETVGGVAYYYTVSPTPAGTCSTVTANAPAGAYFADTTYTGKTLCPAASSTDYFRFNVAVAASSFNAASGEQAILYVVLADTSNYNIDGTGSVALPLYGVTSCGSTSDSGAHCYGIPVTPGNTYSIAILPGDACTGSNNFIASTLSPCSAGSLLQTANTAQQMYLSFRVVSRAATTAVPTIADFSGTTLTELDTQNFQLNFQNKIPTLTCSTSSAYSAGMMDYFPGDSALIVNTSSVTLNSASGGAPGREFIVAGQVNPTAAPNITAALTTSSPALLTRGVPYGGSQAVTGFTNSTLYNISYTVRDATGLVVGSTCSQTSVQSFPIRGFLNTGQCFIASAAFGGMDAAPVRLLRRFRDRVLAPTRMGRAFTDTYYRHSPRAALWLNQHPMFKPPVWLLLIPVEAAAWVFTTPYVVATLGLMAFVFIFISLFFAAPRTSAKKPRKKFEEL